MAGRKWPSDGVVTVGGPGGRLACAVIATSGFVAARPAELIAGEAVVRADVEEIKENSEEGYNDDRTGNSAGDRADP